MLTTEQQRATACAREGFRLDTTAFLDQLATGGIWFAPAYCPSRVRLLTGRFPSATGVRDNQIDAQPRYTADLFDVLHGAGYTTALIGKNHSHLAPDRVDHAIEMGHRRGPARTTEQRPMNQVDGGQLGTAM